MVRKAKEAIHVDVMRLLLQTEESTAGSLILSCAVNL